MTEIQNSSPKTEEIRLSENKPDSTPLVSRSSLCRRFSRGPEVRAKFVESHINKGIAYQLRAMREAQGWSQVQLAAQVGMPQTAISRLESSNYGKPTITTLKRMARIYDVALEVRFVPFSKLLNRISGTPYIESGLSSDALDVPSFEEENSQGVFAQTAEQHTAVSAQEAREDALVADLGSCPTTDAPKIGPQFDLGTFQASLSGTAAAQAQQQELQACGD
jgi:transcriptional regulator with XRE-family HTH domain